MKKIKFKMDCKTTLDDSPERLDFDDYTEAETPEDAFKDLLWGLADLITFNNPDDNLYGEADLENGKVYAKTKEPDEIVETYYNFRAVDIEAEKEYWLGSDGKVYDHKIY